MTVYITRYEYPAVTPKLVLQHTSVLKKKKRTFFLIIRTVLRRLTVENYYTECTRCNVILCTNVGTNVKINVRV